ncbi:MAG: hypothetical protein MUC28_04350, partial [Planctomycetes bacterium]|nr:hypothetical protein [Planctomycetota bacterium]
MFNPKLSKKSEITLTIAPEIKKLFQVIYREQKKDAKPESEEPKIKVSELISKMAFYYEKVRNSVDYKEEHLLRKNAIERILRRQIVIEHAISVRKIKGEDISRHLLTELIRAAYLPNNTIPEAKIGEIAAVVDKYLLLKDRIFFHLKKRGEERSEMAKWVIALAASDIEEHLGRSATDLTVIDYMYKILLKNIRLPEHTAYEQDREIQIFIGIYRNLLKFDPDMIGFILFKYFNAHWSDPTAAEIEEAARNIVPLRQAVMDHVSHPLANQLNRLISRYTVFFSILTDVIRDDPRGVYESFKKDPKAFPRQIKQVCEKRYQRSRAKLWRAAVRSIIYIFITKSIFALILEVPATRLFGEEINSLSLAVNISFPALLLFIIVLFTRLPSEDNSAKIVKGIEEITFAENERTEPFRLNKPVKRSKSLSVIFSILYAVTFFLSFGLVVWGLDKLQFSWVSIIIFLFFLAFVSFFSIRIRKNARDLII